MNDTRWMMSSPLNVMDHTYYTTYYTRVCLVIGFLFILTFQEKLSRRVIRSRVTLVTLLVGKGAPLSDPHAAEDLRADGAESGWILRPPPGGPRRSQTHELRLSPRTRVFPSNECVP